MIKTSGSKWAGVRVLVNLKPNIQYSLREITKLIEEKTGLFYSKPTIDNIIRFSIKGGFLTRHFMGVYARLSISDQDWINYINQQEIATHRVTINGDYTHEEGCQKIIALLQEHVPNPLSTKIILEKMKGTLTKMQIKSRIRVLHDHKVIQRVGASCSTAYTIYGFGPIVEERTDLIDRDINKTQLRFEQDTFQQIIQQNRILKAAFISIAKKLENGEEVRDVLVQTGKLISEMN